MGVIIIIIIIIIRRNWLKRWCGHTCTSRTGAYGLLVWVAQPLWLCPVTSIHYNIACYCWIDNLLHQDITSTCTSCSLPRESSKYSEVWGERDNIHLGISGFSASSKLSIMKDGVTQVATSWSWSLEDDIFFFPSRLTLEPGEDMTEHQSSWQFVVTMALVLASSYCTQTLSSNKIWRAMLYIHCTHSFVHTFSVNLSVEVEK